MKPFQLPDLPPSTGYQMTGVGLISSPLDYLEPPPQKPPSRKKRKEQPCQKKD